MFRNPLCSASSITSTVVSPLLWIVMPRNVSQYMNSTFCRTYHFLLRETCTGSRLTWLYSKPGYAKYEHETIFGFIGCHPCSNILCWLTPILFIIVSQSGRTGARLLETEWWANCVRRCSYPFKQSSCCFATVQSRFVSMQSALKALWGALERLWLSTAHCMATETMQCILVPS